MNKRGGELDSLCVVIPLPSLVDSGGPELREALVDVTTHGVVVLVGLVPQSKHHVAGRRERERERGREREGGKSLRVLGTI